jgi:hypothetical protein
MRLGRRPNLPKPLDRASLGSQRGFTPTPGHRCGAYVRIWAGRRDLTRVGACGSLASSGSQPVARRIWSMESARSGTLWSS